MISSTQDLGRKIIYTDYEDVTEQNVIAILRDAMTVHRVNASRCDFLLNYEKGVQPLQREKTFRPDIDIQCVDNIANEITEFKLGFIWGNSITVTQRAKGGDNSKEIKAIGELNDCYELDSNREKTQELARYVEICGVGYELVDINADYEDGFNAPFTIEPLDPRCTFVVRSTRLGNKVVMGVTYRQDTLSNYYFTCFSKDRRFEVQNMVKIIDPNGKEKSIDKWNITAKSDYNLDNPLGEIPIIEWVRSADRMGCFERQIPEMDNLNILVSDFSNDVDQNTQAIWVTVDVDFPVDENGNRISPESGDWLQLYSTKDGKTPGVKALANPYDYSGMLNNIVTRRALILQKCNVPQRNDNSGGSTGIAMSDATGWSAAESSACKEESILSGCKMNEIKVVLKAIEKNPLVENNSSLLSLKPIDVQPSIKRQKTYEMTTKINAFANAVSHGLDWKSVVNEINFFADPQQVIVDSEETMQRYLDKEFGSDKEEEQIVDNSVVQNTTKLVNSSADPVNQINNSPNVDGMTKQEPTTEE